MLNRRTLRIKIMQSLFAYEQCREANYELALSEVETAFERDLNSMVVRDKDLLKVQRKSALQLAEKKFKDADTPDNADQEVNKVVRDALNTYQKNIKKDTRFFHHHLVTEVERINDRYFSALALLKAFAEVAGKDKKWDARNYVENPWIKSLFTHDELTKNILKGDLGWDNKMEKVRSWFKEIIKLDSDFVQFSELKSPGLEEHKAIIKHMIRKLILGNTPINSYFEEEDIHWSEDHEIIKSLLDKTLKSFDPETGKMELQKLSLDWNDDKEFMDKLYSGTVSLDVSFKQLIARNTKNWEVDRLPLTDRVILEMGITELITFTHIPVKVTINEYIELAKNYSTPKSRQFINGILDVMAKELIASGAIKKSGRGLIDNK
jgi:transcription antitermination protein NusB